MHSAATSQRQDGRFLAAVALICGIGALLRFWWLGAEGLWLDEMFTAQRVMVAEHSFAELIAYTFSHDVHPPLYYLLVSGWAQLFGDSEYALRALSALAGSLTAPALIWVFRRHLDGAGLIALALLGVSVPLFLEASQQARTYPLLILAAAVASGLLLDLACQPAWHGRARRRLAWLTAVLLIGCWLHYFGLVVALGAGVTLLVRWCRDARALRDIALAGLAGLALVLPWLAPHATANLHRFAPGGTWIDPVPDAALVGLFRGLFGQPASLAAVSVAGMAIAAALAFRRGMTPGERLRLRTLLGFFAAMLGVGLASAVFAPSLTIRTVAALAPPLLGAAALVLQAALRTPVRRWRIATAALIVAILLPPALSGLRWASTPRFAQWRESAELVLSWPECLDAEIATYGLWHPIDYYRARFGPQAELRVAELHGNRSIRRLREFAERRAVADEDCPVVFWGDTAMDGAGPLIRGLRRNAPDLVPVRFRKIILLLEPDAEAPPGYERD